jgi:hypothetical protein
MWSTLKLKKKTKRGGKGYCFEVAGFQCFLTCKTNAITTAKRIIATTKSKVENGSVSDPVIMVGIEVGLGDVAFIILSTLKKTGELVRL